MTFRPDSPLNRLVLLWPGVPIVACAVGFGLALFEAAQTGSPGYAALAIAMGFGLALGIGLLFHYVFMVWLEVSVTREGLGLRPVGMVWLKAQPRWIPWARIEAAHEVVTREGGYLRIAAADQVVTLDRALFAPETYGALSQALAESRALPQRAPHGSGLAAAA